jgi:Icc-related predicted phosphoesterase
MEVVVGDIHGEFGVLNHLINNKPDISLILQCGDFGWWPRVTIGSWKNPTLKNKEVKLFWCDGNHEDFQAIKEFKSNEVSPNCFYMERGSVLQLPDKRKILFIGGALSIDRKYRIQGDGNFGWFEEETISQKDIEELLDEKIDIVISHTAPNLFQLNDYHDDYFPKDPSRSALSYVFEKYKPKLWYFGHMHRYQTGLYEGCRWFGLSAPGFPGRWWIPLEEKEWEHKED